MARPQGHVEESSFNLRWDWLDWAGLARGLGSRGFTGRIALDGDFDSHQPWFPGPHPAGAAVAIGASAAEALPIDFDAFAANPPPLEGQGVAEETGSAAISAPAAGSLETMANEDFDRPAALDNDQKVEVLAMLEEALPAAMSMLQEAVAKTFPDAAFHRDGISPMLLDVLTVGVTPGPAPAPITPPVDLIG